VKNISPVQEELLEKHKKKIDAAALRWNEKRGVAALLKGRLGTYRKGLKSGAILRRALSQFGPLIGPEDILKNCRVVSVRKTRDRGLRIRAVQIHDDLPLYGASVVVFSDSNRRITGILSTCWRDVEVTAAQRVEVDNLRARLLRRFRKDDKAREAEGQIREQLGQDSWAGKNFPLVSQPVLWLHAVGRGFHPAFHVLAYGSEEWLGVDAQPRTSIEPVEMMIDAATGRVLWREPTREGMADTDATGSGWSTLEDDTGTHLVRTLQIIQRDGGDYYLINRDQTPDIITHDAGGTETGLVNKLKNDTDISKDGGGTWNVNTNSCTTAQRVGSQQPEVDGHFNAARTWNFYHGCGWDGFDDGNWGDHCPVRVVTHIGQDANAYFDKYTEWDANLGANKYYGYLGFYDGECRSGSLYCDFIAGDPVVFGHEYQHAITFFGAAKADGQPGHLYGSMWLGAIREGLSDTFGCLLTGLWTTPAGWRDGVLRSGQPFRRVEYPRSTDTDGGDGYFDHYDDRDSTKNKYYNSTILSHTAFLAGQGGVHQRTSRSAELIPVASIGRERAAEIFLHALTEYYDQIPTGLAGPTLIEAGRFLLDAAEDISGSNRTCEYVMLRRALYATGLYPYNEAYNKVSYGGEACMLPWTIAWHRSRPYLGFPALWYKSPDLFINNGSGAEYDAEIGQENDLFARVRNIGDQDLSDVRVSFYYRAHGTNLPADMTQWKACQDMVGNDCILDIASLGAGSMNFSDVDSPPAGQAVHWYLDPAAVTDDVDHFCLRAVIECTAPNHDNDCPNYVQSNVQHVEVDAADGAKFAFFANNPELEPIDLDLKVEHTLPKGMAVKYVGRVPLEKVRIKKKSEIPLYWCLVMPRRNPRKLQPPFDGKVAGRINSERISGIFRGELSEIEIGRKLPSARGTTKIPIQGRISGSIDRKASLTGRFAGSLDVASGGLTGKIVGDVGRRRKKSKFIPGIQLRLKGCLEPLRAIHFTQLVRGRPTGGVTLHLKLPRFRGQCDPNKW
jgi:Zn-dependent metalloprotease